MALTHTLTHKQYTPFDPDVAGGPITFEFPDTTLLVNGVETGIYNIGNSSTSVSLQSNAATATDKIENPLSPNTFATSLSGLALPNKRIVWRLDTDQWPTKVWLCWFMWPA